MGKFIPLIITLIVALSAVLITMPGEVTADDMESPTKQPVRFYMYEPGDNGNISFEKPTSDEDEEEDCPQGGNMETQSADVGTWRSQPIIKPSNLSGPIEIFLWAKGDVRDVQFTIDISIDGSNTATFQTNTNDTESEPKLFYATGNINWDPNEAPGLNTDDRIQMDISFSGGETNPIEGPNRQATIVYGSTEHPSGFSVQMDTISFDYTRNDIEVNDENDEDDPETIMVTSKIHNTFGVMDIKLLGFNARTNDYEGETYSHTILEETDEYVKVKWTWRYGTDNARTGRYELNVTATDLNGNIWWKNLDIQIVTQLRPKMDFVITDNDLAVDPTPVYAKKSAFINVTVHCYGDDDLKGLVPNVIVTITTPSGGKEEFYRQITVDSNSENVLQIKFYFNVTGAYSVDAEVNPEEGMGYEETNDAGTAGDNNVGSMNIQAGKKPKKDDDNEWYEDLRDDFENDENYQMGIIGIAAAAVVISVLLLKMRRKKSKEEDEYDEYEDYEEE